jgi:2-methylcitrate dehydratase
LLDNPELVELMQRIRVVVSEQLTSMYPQAAPARVIVHTRNGDSLSSEVHFPEGHSRHPMSDAAVEGKFRKLAGGAANTAACEVALSTLWAIEGCSDVSSTIIPLLAEVLAHGAQR